jgi:tetratricopeptide (TPR) repeat protein
MGFGGPRNDVKSEEMLSTSGKSKDELDRAIRYMHDLASRPPDLPGSIFRNLEHTGHLDSVMLSQVPAAVMEEHRQSGRLRDAETALQQEIQDATVAIPKEPGYSFVVAYLTLWLSYALQYQDRCDEAESLLLKLMDNSAKALGKDHQHTGDIRMRLASVYREQNRWEKDEALVAYEIDAKKRLLGPEHRVTVLLMLDQLMNSAQYASGEVDFEESHVQLLELTKKVYGPSHPCTLNFMIRLATLFKGIGRLDAALQLEKHVVEANTRMFGHEHEQTISSSLILGTTYWTQIQLRQYDEDKIKEAEALFKQCVEGSRKVYGPEHPETLMSMTTLWQTHFMQHQWGAAEELGMQTFDISKRVYGAEHPKTLESMRRLAATYKEMAKWEEAENHMRPMMDIQKKVLGVEHPETLASINFLGELCKAQGRDDEAETLWLQVVDTDTTHMATMNSLINLASMYPDERGLEFFMKAKVLSESMPELAPFFSPTSL